MRGLAEDRSIIIKPPDKGSCVAMWDRADYLAKAENPLSDCSTYKEVKFGEDGLAKIVEQSNRMFKRPLSKNSISSEECNYLGKMYFLPKIHKRLDNVPGLPVIYNCGTVTGKASEFLDHHLTPLMQSVELYDEDTSDFLSKIKELWKVPDGAILVTDDVVGLYPSITHEDDLNEMHY